MRRLLSFFIFVNKCKHILEFCRWRCKQLLCKHECWCRTTSDPMSQLQTPASSLLPACANAGSRSLLLHNVGSASASPSRLTSKVSKLVRSIHHAEQSLAYPRTNHLDPKQVAQFGICTKSAHAVLSSASSVLGNTDLPPGQSSLLTKSDTTSEWGFTFLESDSSDPPVVHVDLGHENSVSRTEAWITQRAPSQMIEPNSKSSEKSAPPSELPQEDWLLSQSSNQSQIYWDDSSSSSSSEYSLNLDAGLYSVFMDLGDQSLGEDRFPQAETYFRKALDRLQSSSSFHDRRLIKQKIGVACLEQGKYDEAKAIFDQHPDLARSIIERIFAKARSFYDEEQYQCAINCLRRALTDTHDAPADVVREMRMLFGLAHLALNELAEARSQLSLVLLPDDQTEDSRSLEAHHNLALVHLRQGEIHEAIKHAQIASKGRWRLFSRDHATSQESLAVLVDAFEAKGDTEEAKAYYKLLTEDELKVHTLLHDVYFLFADLKQKRRMQARAVALRKRFSNLRKRDRILAAMEDTLFADEVESFVKHYLVPEDGPVEDLEEDSLLLLSAAQAGRTVIVRALLRDSKLDLRASDLSGDTALHHAVRNGSEEITILLLRQIGTGINIQNEYGETALAVATRGRNESMIRLLLKSTRLNPNLEVRKPVDPKIINHGPALHIAVVNKSESIVELLIQQAANIDLNYRDAQGRTPLHYALLSGNARICEMLLQQPSVRLNSVTEPEKQSPLSLAIIKDMVKLAHQLIAKREVDVNPQDHQGHTALHHSAWCNQPDIMVHLLQRRSLNVNLKDLCGRTALHVAAACGNAKLVKQLIADPRTDVDCKNNYKETPFSAARAANHKDVLNILERHQITTQFLGYRL